jgi:hypothetical protein
VSAEPASVTVLVSKTSSPSSIEVDGALLMVTPGSTLVTAMVLVETSTSPPSSSLIVTVATKLPLSVGVKVNSAALVTVPPGRANALPFLVTLQA